MEYVATKAANLRAIFYSNLSESRCLAIQILLGYDYRALSRVSIGNYRPLHHVATDYVVANSNYRPLRDVATSHQQPVSSC